MCDSDSLFSVLDEASLELTPSWSPSSLGVYPDFAVCVVTLYLLQMKLEARFDHNAQVRPSDQERVLPQ